MRLLQLSPDATRLRRIAKAYAAGELSRIDYRQARREVIGKFAQGLPGDDEDTVPRYDREITQRRASVAEQPIDVDQSPNRALWALFMALIIALLLVPLVSQAAEVIPPVSDRDPNPDTAARYAVDAVLWQIPLAIDAVMAQDAQAFLRERLAAAKQQNAPQAHGFSDSELEVSGITVEERTDRPAADGDIHISFRFALDDGGVLRHGTLLLPISASISLGAHLMMAAESQRPTKPKKRS